MSSPSTPHQPNQWPPGGGEMGRRIREYDWSAHPLGPVEHWPQSLKTTVQLMLSSRYAMWMGWGQDFWFFCNDAYLPTLGIKESWGLGASARKVWAEIWPDIGPRAESVVETGKATWDEGLLLYLKRRGFAEETYHTFSYSPIPSDDGGIGGMLCVVTEETDRLIGERRLALLQELSSGLTGRKSETDLFETVCHCLGSRTRDLPMALIYLFDDTRRSARLVCNSGADAPASLAPPVLSVDEQDGTWPLMRILEESGPLELDLSPWSAELPGPADEPLRRAVVARLFQQGVEQPVGFLAVALNPHRPDDQGYRGLLEMVAGQISSGLSNVRSYEEQRRRAEALAELDRAKTAFFSNVSHEFRTPLTLMLGPLQDMLAEDNGGDGPQRELVEVAHRNGLRLLKLVNNLLDFARIEAGRIQAAFEPVDLPALTADLASGFRSAIEKAGLKFVVDCPPIREPVYVDVDLWEKVVLNLLSNALKFTLDGEITVTVRDVADHVELLVRDTGSGIPREAQDRLFERFYRVHGVQGRSHEGSGIGLAFVAELVRLHGGDVRVTSEVGDGSTFIVSVPHGHAHLPADQVRHGRTSRAKKPEQSYLAESEVWRPASATAQEVVSDAADIPSAERTILVADDNADMRDYIARLVGSRYHVITVADGQAAVEAMETRLPDLVLTDIMMPRLDGFGLLAAIRSRPEWRSLPVILLSARAGDEARVEGLDAGADDYLVKPFTAPELLARIKTQLHMERLRREALTQVRSAETRLRQMLDLLPAAVYTCDLEGRISYYNETAAELWGVAPPLYSDAYRYCVCAKVVQPDGKVIPPEQTAMALAIRDGSSVRNVEVEYFRQDGKSFASSVSVSPLTDAEGVRLGAVAVFQDITQAKSTKLALERQLLKSESSSHHAAFLGTLTQRLALLSDPGAIITTACRELGMHLAVDRCFFTESAGDKGAVRVTTDWAADGLSSLAGEYRPEDFASPELLSQTAPATLAIPDVADHPYTQPVAANFAKLNIRSFAVAPYVRGDGSITNIMVTDSDVREWQPEEVTLLENLVARTRPLIDQARATQAVRENAERLRLALAAAQMGDWNWDFRSNRITMSAAAAAIFGVPAGEPMDRDTLRSLVHEEDARRGQKVIDEAIRRRSDYDIEYRVMKPGQPSVWVASKGRPLFAEDGQLTGMLGVVQDITARKLDEEARSRLAAIVESSDDGIVSKDLNGIITSWNLGAQRIFGYTEEEMIGKPITTIIPSERLGEETEIISRIRRGQKTDHFETVRKRKDGTLVDVSVTISPLFDRNGVVIGASKIARDVSGQKRSELELRASERRWRQLAEAMPHLVWISAPAGEAEFISAQWCAYTGHSEREQRGFGWTAAIHPEDRKMLEAAWNKAAHARNILDMEIRIRRSDGVYRWFKTRVVPVTDSGGNIVKWYGSSTDIEDIKRTDVALRENESRLSALFAQAGSGIIQSDLEGRIVMVNDAYCEIVNRPREQILGMRIHDLTHPDDRKLHQTPFEDMMRGGSSFIIEKRDLRPDGSFVWVRNSVVGIRDADGQVTAGLTIAQDITDSREAEDAMRASEEQLRLVTDHAPVLLAQFDRQHRYKFVNQPYASRYGCEPQELVGRHAAEILGAADYESMRGRMELAFGGQRVEFEIKLPQEKGKPRWGHVIFVPERTQDGEVVGIVTVLTDITRRKEEEQELEQARDRAVAAARAKDEFLARLSHELRTPLSPVLLLASEGAQNPDLPPSVRADLDIIRKNVDLEARLIDDLLDLTRITRGKLALDLKELPLNSVIHDAIDTLRSEITQKNIVIDLQLQQPAPTVTGDAVRLQQVFWNLLNNSVKFSNPGGRITVRTNVCEPDRRVCIDVIDSGIGLTSEELQRVFDAFSQGDHAGSGGSTRFGGLGLGLAISRMLVELHQGQLRAASGGRGQGATFSVELPLSAAVVHLVRFDTGDAQPTGPLVSDPSRSAKVSNLRILLVEDHEPTRTALSNLLTRRRHSVKTAASLAEAREVMNAEQMDLLISDIGLPDGTGYELMREFRGKDDLKGIALSGYGMEHDIAKSREAGFSTHLTKPVRMEALDRAIVDAMVS